MSIRKKWYIQVMRADSSKSMSWSLSNNGLQILIGILLVIGVVLGAGTVRVISRNSDLARFNKLQQENDLLRDRMSYFSTQMDSVLIKIKIMENWEDELREERRLKLVNPDVRAMGTGGEPSYDPSFLLFDAYLDEIYNENLRKLNFVQSKAMLVYETHSDLMNSLHTRDFLYRTTPSIWPSFGNITSRFGGRHHPVLRRYRFHAGVDIANDRGTPVYATADGTVSFAGYSGESGNLIRINHASGYQTRYAHLDVLLVRPGELVEKGQIIARMGNSGNSTGSHLHYEVMDTKRFRMVNPANFFNLTEDQINVAGGDWAIEDLALAVDDETDDIAEEGEALAFSIELSEL